MKIKNLHWNQTSKRLLNKGSNRERITETWQAVTVFGTFTVYSSVGGGIFYKPVGYQGISDMFSASHRGGIVAGLPPRCKSIEDGKAICQAIFEKSVKAFAAKCFE
jgi:hypothetical protein